MRSGILAMSRLVRSLKRISWLAAGYLLDHEIETAEMSETEAATLRHFTHAGQPGWVAGRLRTVRGRLKTCAVKLVTELHLCFT